MKKIEKAIKKYEIENGEEYERLIISRKFYDELAKESIKEDSIPHIRKIQSVVFNFRDMEIKEGANFDFKLLP